ncbi:MAG TPA: hypothetical protein PLL77_13240 [Pyrinomonadaceae bacterium]|nr:hypothetical protein [Pyrinomonadaceae bacterium]
MRKFVAIIFVTLLLTTFSLAQTKPKPKPRSTPVKAAPSVDKGTVSGRTYTNKTFKFEVTFPNTWLIPGDDFEAYMKKQGFDLALKAPDSLPPVSKAKVDQAIKNVEILLTAYRSMPGETDNAIVRISVENLVLNPQIKDAVDYFDAIRTGFASMKLPADFKYSETQAEKLGTMQFGYLDTSTTAGKKRMYATVRDGFSVMFTISYSKDADLQTLRGVLEQGNFRLK